MAALLTCAPLHATQAADREAGNANAIAARLGGHTVVQGEFIQQRQVQGIPQGLRSAGEFLFWREHGLYWATHQPLEQAVTYRADKTLRWSANGAGAQAGNRPADEHLRRLLLAIFSFDTRQLARQFEQQWLVNDAHWELQLSPKDAGTRRFLTRVVLEGAAMVEVLRVTFSNGERLTISFHDSQTLAAIDWQSCSRYFAYAASECEALGVTAGHRSP